MNKLISVFLLVPWLCWADTPLVVVPVDNPEPLLELPPDIKKDDSMSHALGKIATWNLDRLKKTNPSLARKLQRVGNAVKLDINIKKETYSFGTSGDLKTRSIKSILKFSDIKMELKAAWPEGLVFETIYKPCGLSQTCGSYFGQQKGGESLIGWKRSF